MWGVAPSGAAPAPASSGGWGVAPGPAPKPLTEDPAFKIAMGIFAPGLANRGVTGTPSTPQVGDGSTFKDTLQAVPRSLVQTGIGVGQAVRPETIGTKIPTSEFGPVGETLFGPQPLQGLGDNALGTSKFLSEKWGIPQGIADGLGVTATAAMSVADFMGLGISKRVAEMLVGDSSRAAKVAETTIPTFRATEPLGTLPERLAATGERRLPVTSDATGRPLPVAGDSVEHTIPNANRYTPDSQLPVIEAGKPGKSSLPVIQTEARASKLGDRPVLETRPIEVPGNKVSGVATDMQKQAVLKGFQESENLAHFNSRVMSEQAGHLANIIATNPADLGKFVRGELPIPKEISPEFLRSSAENYALKTGDKQLYHDIISSKLTGALSQHGSEFRMSQIRDVFSPSDAVRRIEAGRVKAFAKQNESFTNAVDQKIAEGASKQSLIDYIKTIPDC